VATVLSGTAKAADGGSLVSRVVAAPAGSGGLDLSPFGPALAELTAASPVLADLLARGFSDAPYLCDLARADPARLVACLEASPEARVASLIEALGESHDDGEAGLMRRLRLAKQEVALVVALADLGGVWSVAEVTGALARLADASVAAAVRFLLREAAGQGRFAPPDPANPDVGSGLIVLAMGKQGAFELNYSSDIDIIVFFDGETAPVTDRSEVQTFFVRLVKRLVKILQERTADGYAFRTDLRLRPDPGATAAAVSVTSALTYYEVAGQNWERAAMIKARPSAGDIAAGEAFLKELAPFIWRKYLDYAAIRDIQSIKRQINAVKGHGGIAVAGHNVKLGRGGIREIEFFVQTQQLIAGGRRPELRGRGTVAMLYALVEHGWVAKTVADELSAAYEFLRRVEHRIQMMRDEQSHTLPVDEAGLLTVARLCGYDTTAAFGEALTACLSTVQRHYARLFAEEEDLSAGAAGNLVFTGDEDDPDTIAALKAMGYRRPEEVTRIVRAWHHGRYPAMRSARAREVLTELVPRLLAALAATDAADQALGAFDAFVARLPAGVQLFSLLGANPHLLDLLATIMGTAPRLAETVARRVHVVDAVLDPAFFGQLPEAEDLGRHLAATLGEARGYEEALDRARIFGQEQAFLIGVRVISGTLSAQRAGAAYARLADELVKALLAAAGDELARQHGRIPGGRVAVVAMGKLGGREMTAASDLDLILLYDHDEGATASDGARPLAPSQYYIRLTQRLVAALSALTAEGRLYEVDFRLRPSGNAGPLATQLESFLRYQREDAWTWEHMALTRARVIAGPPELAAAIERAVEEIVARPREAALVHADVAAMRARISAGKGTSDLWNLKLVPGGLVDIEFIAQDLQLTHAAEHPSLMATNTEIVLERAASLGVLDADAADVLLPAIRLYQDLTQLLRLGIAGTFKPSEAPRGFLDLLTRATDMPDIARLEAHLVATEARVREVFERLIGPVVEGAALKE
jgi:glutamate-ammonia-ligase adenylyltransferase